LQAHKKLMKRFIIFALFLTAILTAMISCRKEDSIITDPSVQPEFSQKEVLFDTVFTTIGSTTKMFWVKNSGNARMVISRIFLAGGSASDFTLNVDGIPGKSFEDIEIGKNDSIFIFVKVTVDPQNSNSPMVIRDSVVFEVNGVYSDVDLTAWGQDAHYIVANSMFGGYLPYRIVAREGENIIWTNDKPYLIYGYAVVDSTGTLNIEEGTRIHFYNKAGMWIYRGGRLLVNGTVDQPVSFQGSRLEQAYKNIPGQWDRIWINEGGGQNVIRNAVIKNGFIGIQAETLGDADNTRLILENVRILNMSGIGLLSRYYHIAAGNSVFANCGVYTVCLTTGGAYDFRHCTMANYWNYSSRQTPALVVANYYEDAYSGYTYLGDLDSAYFGNCIIYGNAEKEILIDSLSGALCHYKFENCLLKTTPAQGNFFSCLYNQDPYFKDASAQDYRLSATSAAIDIGTQSILYGFQVNILYDIIGNSRLANPPPDAGAYDYSP
jgi:hypothetical protein